MLTKNLTPGPGNLILLECYLMKNNESSITSLVSAFSRAYHVKEDRPIIFNDYVAQDFLSIEEYRAISINMSNGIAFFSPEMAEQLKAIL